MKVVINLSTYMNMNFHLIGQIEPEWRQAQSLKKAIEDKITKGNSPFMFGV